MAVILSQPQCVNVLYQISQLTYYQTKTYWEVNGSHASRMSVAFEKGGIFDWLHQSMMHCKLPRMHHK